MNLRTLKASALRIRFGLNRAWSHVSEPQRHELASQVRRDFCGKQVKVVKLAGRPCEDFTGKIDYVRYEPPTSHIVPWGASKGDVVLGFAWDGEPDRNGETGIELIWGLDEVAIVGAGR